MKPHDDGTLILLLVTSVFLGACSASGRYLKNADRLAEAGLYEEAAEQYYYAAKSNPKNMDARIGLKSTAQKVLDSYLSLFSQYANRGQHDNAFEQYNICEQYRIKIKDVGVTLNVSSVYTNLYNDTLLILADRHYSSAMKYYDTGNWSEAIKYFDAALRYHANYKDAVVLRMNALQGQNLAEAERVYTTGVTQLRNSDYRSAYYSFERALKIQPGYKNATALMTEAREKGKVTLVIMPFDNSTTHRNIEEQVYAYTITNAVDYPSPFIHIIDRANLQRVLREQSLGTSGIVDPRTAARIGRVLGAKAVVLGDIMNVRLTGGDIREERIDAWELYQVKINEIQTETRGRKTTLPIYSASISVTPQIHVQVIDVETAQILISDIYEATSTDDIIYSKYSGDPAKLVLMDPYMQITSLLPRPDPRLFSARRTLKSTTELISDLTNILGNQISNAICRFFDR